MTVSLFVRRFFAQVLAASLVVSVVAGLENAALGDGAPDDFRIRWYGGIIERDGGKSDGAITKLTFRDGSDFGNEQVQMLQGLDGLKELDLSETKVRDLGLQSLPRLKRLDSISLPRVISNNGLKAIEQLTTLKKLEITGIATSFVPIKGVDDKGLGSLRSFPELEYLTLRGLDVSDNGLKEVVENKKLIELNLIDIKISDEGLPILAKLPKLERITLGWTNITPEGLRCLKTFPKLKSVGFVMKHPATNDEAVRVIKEAGLGHLLPNPQRDKKESGKTPTSFGIDPYEATPLREYWGARVGRNSIEIDGMRPHSITREGFRDADIEAISRVHGVKELWILDARFVKGQGFSFLSKCNQLTEVHLVERSVTTGELEHLVMIPNLQILEVGSLQGNVKLLQKCKTLKELWVGDLRWFSDELLAQFDGIGKLDCLVTTADFERRPRILANQPMRSNPGLSLHRSQVTPKGLGRFSGNSAIQWVRLSSAQMTEEGAKVLQSLPNLTKVSAPDVLVNEGVMTKMAGIPNLQTLECNLTPASARLLSTCKKMRMLDIKEVNDDVLREIAMCPRLAVLRLDGAKVTDAGLAHLKKMSDLLSLELIGMDNVSGRAVNELKALFPKCMIRRY